MTKPWFLRNLRLREWPQLPADLEKKVHGADSASPSGPSSRSASNPPCTSSSTNVTTVVNQTQNFAGFSVLSPSNVNVFVCYLDGDNKLNSLVEVSVNYVYRPLFGFKWPSVTIRANSAGRIVF